MQCLLLPIFALYRHVHIKNKIAPSTGSLMLYSSVALIPLIFSLMTSALSGCTTQQITTDLILSWPVETPLPRVFVVIDLRNAQYGKIGYLYRRLVAYGPFILTVFIAAASVRLLRREWPKLNAKAKTAQRIFSFVLAAQAMLPFTSMFIPNIILTMTAFVNVPFGVNGVRCL
ncbi:hypothetical protein M3Y95_01160400 [Aphelenchoides besseyi]|nr:hypothetical protein M3Y95_01160400 [Aphelenchoides besseyi]